MADAKTTDGIGIGKTVFTGSVKSPDGDDELAVRLVEAPVPPPVYPFGWGVTAYTPAIWGPVRRPLFLYDLLLIGLPMPQQRLLAYLMRRSIAEKLGGGAGGRIPVPSWRDVAWELGSEEKAVRTACRELGALAVVREEGQRPRTLHLSPFVHYVGKMARLEKNWTTWVRDWTPSQEVWDAFWARAPIHAQLARIVRNEDGDNSPAERRALDEATRDLWQGGRGPEIKVE